MDRLCQLLIGTGVDGLHQTFIGAIIFLCGVIGVGWRFYTGRLEKRGKDKDDAVKEKEVEMRELLDKKDELIADKDKKIGELYEDAIKIREEMLAKVETVARGDSSGGGDGA